MSPTFRKMQNAVCDASTGHANGNHYYESVGHAYGAVDSRLLKYGYRIDPDDWCVRSNNANFSAPGGCRIVVEFVDCDGSQEGYAVLSFHRMQSGRYELTAYLA